MQTQKSDEKLIFLPIPQEVNRLGEIFELPENLLIVIDGDEVRELWPTARRFQNSLYLSAGLLWEIVVGDALPDPLIGLRLTTKNAGEIKPQGYELSILKSGIEAKASDPSGVFYGVCTLIQIIQQCERQLPTMVIKDWPDYQRRGVMLDVSRDKVPTMNTLFLLLDTLASWKINQFQLYTEHTFAYRRHPDVWAEASPITGDEILFLDAFCRERFIDLVPNQNSFGHMNRWLKFEKYRPLAESPDGFKLYNRIDMGPEMLNPVIPQSLEFMESLYDELLPHFSSSYFNVGLDETFELGEGRSREDVERRGKGQVYLDYLLSIHQAVKSRGKRMMFWADMAVKNPRAAAKIPKDAIALVWGYEAGHPFAEQCRIFADSGIDFFVCPGTSSWRSLSGRTQNALLNIADAAKAGLEHGAGGLLNTDWGDRGHWQPLPVSYPGYAFGAAMSWRYSENKNIDLGSALSMFAFSDSENLMGKICLEFGHIHLATGCEAMNSTILFNLLQCPVNKAIELIDAGDPGVAFDEVNRFLFEDSSQHPPELILQKFWGEFYKLDEGKLNETINRLDSLLTEMNQVNCACADNEIILREYRYISNMLRHACKRGIWILGKKRDEESLELRKILIGEIEEIIAEHQEIWTLRNRIGGLKDSLGGLERLKDEYLNA